MYGARWATCFLIELKAPTSNYNCRCVLAADARLLLLLLTPAACQLPARGIVASWLGNIFQCYLASHRHVYRYYHQLPRPPLQAASDFCQSSAELTACQMRPCYQRTTTTTTRKKNEKENTKIGNFAKAPNSIFPCQALGTSKCRDSFGKEKYSLPAIWLLVTINTCRKLSCTFSWSSFALATTQLRADQINIKSVLEVINCHIP